ncbi:MAG TPA: iron-sulfur cluster assembly scaffold protein [Terriglobales bacterium]|nr:iron-sulfur cluster assembly scaffold protein [Terriglobales bacterium]
MYSPQVLDHFQNPRFVGELPDATVSVEVQNPACGDILKLSLRVADGRIEEVRFRAMGCVPAIACGSKLAELLAGRTLVASRGIRREELVEALGGLPAASMHASHLAMDALAAALKKAGASRSERA